MEQVNNVSFMSATPKKIHRWYLILSIIYSSILVLTGISPFILGPLLFLPINLILGPVTMAWFVVNIVMFILIFVRIFAKKIEKVALLLPGLYIFAPIFSIIVNDVVGEAELGRSVLHDLVVRGVNLPLLAIILGIAIKSIILGIAIYLISRK